jgi:hypothetical protein
MYNPIHFGRRMKKENEIHSNWWRIPWEDLVWVVCGKSKTSCMGLSTSKVFSSDDIVFL